MPCLCVFLSGVQGLLDARGQRGSWMQLKIFSFRPGKFLTTFFKSRLLNFFPIRLKKFLTTFFSHLSKFFTFSHQLSNFTKIRSLDAPPVLHHAPVATFFSSFLSFTDFFKTKTGPLNAPPGWMPGAVAPSAPPSARHWCFFACLCEYVKKCNKTSYRNALYCIVSSFIRNSMVCQN